MPKPASVTAYFDKLEGETALIARALRKKIEGQWPDLKSQLAWGFPCWRGKGRIFSIVAFANRCNLQLWQGARLAQTYFDRIEGTGKALRHVKVHRSSEIDDELVDIIDRAVALDRAEI